METLQIRLPAELIVKVDKLVESGLYNSRSEVLRHALQEYISHSNLNGSLPFIVGPFKTLDIDHIFDMPPDSFQPSPEVLAEVRKKVKSLRAI
jgi:hypothetical protein